MSEASVRQYLSERDGHAREGVTQVTSPTLERQCAALMKLNRNGYGVVGGGNEVALMRWRIFINASNATERKFTNRMEATDRKSVV